MNTTQHLAELLTLPAPEFDRYLEAVNQVAQLRRHAEPALSATSPALPAVPAALAGVTPVAQLPPVVSMAPQRLATRPPMRAAKPGTLRGDIHDVLRSGGRPMRRIAIIKAVANRRGRPVDETFRGKVGDVLTNPHDPFLRRVEPGTYEFVEPEGARS